MSFHPYLYLVTPFITWFITGCLKFCITALQQKRTNQALKNMVGYGGMPSNHSAIVTSMTTLIGLQEGIQHPAFGVAITLAFITIVDAQGLRREIGKYAIAINSMRLQASSTETVYNPTDRPLLRERMGHTWPQIFAGMATGAIIAYLLFLI